MYDKEKYDKLSRLQKRVVVAIISDVTNTGIRDYSKAPLTEFMLIVTTKSFIFDRGMPRVPSLMVDVDPILDCINIENYIDKFRETVRTR